MWIRHRDFYEYSKSPSILEFIILHDYMHGTKYDYKQLMNRQHSQRENHMIANYDSLISTEDEGKG